MGRTTVPYLSLIRRECSTYVAVNTVPGTYEHSINATNKWYLVVFISLSPPPPYD